MRMLVENVYETTIRVDRRNTGGERLDDDNEVQATDRICALRALLLQNLLNFSCASSSAHQLRTSSPPPRRRSLM